MQRMILSASLMVLSCGAAFGQASPSFEVASVKPAEPPPAGQMGLRVMMRGGPGTPDPGQITYSNVTLKNVMMAAYDVKGYQITGPKWLDSERYDIVAKIPKGSSKEDVKLMLQNLLAERFKLALHKESKELPIYALVVAKGGAKLKETVEDTPAAGTAAAAPGGSGPSGGASSAFAPPPPPPPSNGPNTSFSAGGGPGGAGIGKISMGSDGQIKIPGGMPKGAMMMMMSNGRMHMVGNGQPIGRLVDTLSNQLGRPVVDQTGLTAKYDIDLDFAPEGMNGPMGMMMPPPGHDGAGGGGGAAPAAAEPQGPSLVTALKEQLGLQLESKKGPVDMLIVDKLEKNPIEN